MKSAGTTFLELDWFYDLFDLDLDLLKNTWTTLLDSDCFYYTSDLSWLNELTEQKFDEKSMKTFFELSVKQYVIQGRMSAAWKSKY